MNLELTDAERVLILDVLEDRTGELREEIHHSQLSNFTDELKQREESLRTIIEKLKDADG